ncbi:MAG: DUF3592 domain-containing protein [Alphaproteobacteria bacterium]|nr:MAG: DUF3592 domain-containing protein [Alphaproteobacteria bacterium]
MFDILFDGISAWNQTGLMIGGLICFLIGGLFLADFLYWRIKGIRVKGEIKAVKAKISRMAHSRNEQKEEEERKQEEAAQEGFWKGFKKNPFASLFALIFAGMFIAFPFVFIGIGAYHGYKYYDLKTHGIHAEGMIVQNKHETDSEGGSSYYAIVSFTDNQGRLQEHRDSISNQDGDNFRRGTHLSVYYQADKPSRFIIDDFWHNMAAILIFPAFGLFFIGIVFFISHMNKKQKHKEEKPDKPNYMNEMYTAVYEYQLPTGEVLQADGTTSSNMLTDKIPGTRVTLLVSPNKPDRVRRPGKIGITIAMILLGVGGVLFYAAFQTFKFSMFSVLFPFLLLGYVGVKIYSKMSANPEMKAGIKKMLQDVRDRKQPLVEFDGGSSSSSAGADFLTEEEISARLYWMDRYNQYWVPVLLILGVAAIIGGNYLSDNLTQMLEKGISTKGHVVRMESRHSSSSDSSGPTYHAVVEFETQQGKKISFTDKMGASHPLYETGDEVTVVYEPRKPRDAMIDRGIWNWAVPGGLMAFGCFLIWGALSTQVKILRRRRRAV